MSGGFSELLLQQTSGAHIPETLKRYANTQRASSPLH